MNKNTEILNDKTAAMALHRISEKAVRKFTAIGDDQECYTYCRLVLDTKLMCLYTEHLVITESPHGVDELSVVERGLTMRYVPSSSKNVLEVSISEAIKHDQDDNFCKTWFETGPATLNIYNAVTNKFIRRAKPNAVAVREWRKVLPKVLKSSRLLVHNTAVLDEEEASGASGTSSTPPEITEQIDEANPGPPLDVDDAGTSASITDERTNQPAL